LLSSSFLMTCVTFIKVIFVVTDWQDHLITVLILQEVELCGWISLVKETSYVCLICKLEKMLSQASEQTFKALFLRLSYVKLTCSPAILALSLWIISTWGMYWPPECIIGLRLQEGTYKWCLCPLCSQSLLYDDLHYKILRLWTFVMNCIPYTSPFTHMQTCSSADAKHSQCLGII
jgi:hypothetical protein